MRKVCADFSNQLYLRNEGERHVCVPVWYYVNSKVNLHLWKIIIDICLIASYKYILYFQIFWNQCILTLRLTSFLI